MARGRRLSQEINAGSMADIAFLLLVFFLVTTTMDTDWGLQRLLPPPDVETDDTPIKQRNVFVVLVNANDQLLVEGELMDVSQLREAAKEFIENPDNSDQLPEKREVTVSIAQGEITRLKPIATGDNEKAIEELKKWQKRLNAAKVVGRYFESKQVISLQNDRGTSYNMYIQVQNELAAAYRELRDDLAEKQYGKKFANLSKEEGKIVKVVYPQKISEAEPNINE